MKYILDNNGYVESASCNPISCDDKVSQEYKGTIPDGYETLDEWILYANIRAYKIVNNNLVYDAAKDAELQEEWANTGKSVAVIDKVIKLDNGYYIKYGDGRMEVHMTVEETVNISTAWGSLYVSPTITLPDFPEPFIERPTITRSLQPKTGTQFFEVNNGNQNYGSATRAGATAIGRPNSRTGVSLIIDITANGWWKEVE